MNKETVKKNVCTIKECGRPTHKKSKYCIFHASAKEKTEKEFKEALKEYVNMIKDEDKDYYFKGFIFVGDINFREDLSITIFKNTNFWEATFEGYAAFAGVTFKGDASFIRATFKGGVSFDRATFERYAHWNGATFEGYASFARATFEGDAHWNVATFEYTGFEETTFKGDASFIGATFKGDASFDGATFEKDAEFIVKNIKKNMNFANTVFNPRKTLEINTLDIVNEVVINFEKAYLENVYLELILGEKTLIYFTTEEIYRNIIIKGNQIKNHILQEERKDFEQAKEVYLLLKNNFHSIGRYEDESWAFKKEKDMERKNYCHFKSLHKWLWSCFLNGIFGYGEQPGKVIISAIIIILIFTFLFMHFGIDANSQLDTLPKYNILKELFMGIRYGDLLIRLKDISLEQIKNCLYFSTVTFTTLGLGDFRPVEGWGRIFVGIEAFIGALIMALFVYTFARRTGGR